MKRISKRSSSTLLVMAIILGVTGVSSSHLNASASTFLQADTTNPYGGAAIDPLPDTAVIFSVKKQS